MAIIRWLNRHVFTSIIIYFALMGGIAWGVNQSIADRDPLETMPADGDLIAIYDLDETAGKRIAVSTFRGDNLNAIVNADTVGSASPGITTYDNNTGTNDGTSFIHGTTLGAVTSKAVTMSIGVEEASGSTVNYITVDGVNERINALKPMNSGRITDWLNINTDAAIDLDTDYPNVCDLTVFVWDSGETLAIEFELWNNALCNGIADYGKRFCVIARTDSITMTIDPDDSDKLSFHTLTLGAAGSSTANTSDALGDGICFIGSELSAVQYWVNEPGSVVGTWSQPTP